MNVIAISDKGIFASGFFFGVLSPFAAVLGVALLLWLGRRIGQVMLYAKPKYLERRLNMAAQFVDARRAYRLGCDRLWFALCVGRQWRHDGQAAAVLKDEFMPIPEDEPVSSR